MTAYLVSGLICTTALSVLAYAAGRSQRVHRVISSPICFAVTLCSAAVLPLSLASGIQWIDLLPLPDVLLWSSVIAPCLCFTAGLATCHSALRPYSQPLAAVSLVGMALGYTLVPVLRPAFSPVSLSKETQWGDGICLQSHISTCAPAAAVTLLRNAGIIAEERDLVRVCSTSEQGTESLGLYRGVRIYSNTVFHKVCVASSNTDVWISGRQLPNLSIVNFKASNGGFPNQLFASRRDRHAVVVFGRNDTGGWVIGDPAFGKTTWSDEEFQARFTGEALYVAGPRKKFEF
ncbi:MAG: hypothetical protein CBE43_09130 [Rhodopirellula sp. TMED283]|nr:MAG: hypothetical protein CBE43_09130 [Rhodopirellula sp. TMED283]